MVVVEEFSAYPANHRGLTGAHPDGSILRGLRTQDRPVRNRKSFVRRQ